MVELPAIRIEPRLDAPRSRDAVADLHTYALVCLTSPNGVRLLFEAMAAQGRDARALANATVAAIGPGTAAALAEHGVIADVVPERFVAEALVEALAEVDVAGRPVLVARAAEARDVLPDALASAARRSTSSPSTRPCARSPTPRRSRRAAGADYVTFTSSSTVRNLLAAIGDRFPRRGPGRLDRPGHQRDRPRAPASRSHVEAERHDPSGLVEALVADAGATADRGG